MNILKRIVEFKREEVAELKKKFKAVYFKIT